MRVLVVNDESRYRVYLSARLRREGHQVAVAGNAREAVDVGLRFCPEVLVIDWMLADRVNGLDVTRALRGVDPDLVTLLITGFASDDLRVQARRARCACLIEKPFDPETLVAAIDRAPNPPPRRGRVPFGVVVTSPSGLVLHASPRALRMFDTLESDEPLLNLGAAFSGEAAWVTQESLQDWALVAPRSWKRIRWWVRSRQLPDGLVSILLPERRRFLRGDPRIRMLLDLPAAIGSVYVASQRILIVDDQPFSDASTYLDQLERVGCIGYKAGSAELAIRLFQADSEIGAALVDWDMPGIDPVALVVRLREIRLEVRVLGLSKRSRTKFEFRTLGIGFLQKPWTAGDLLHALEFEAGVAR